MSEKKPNFAKNLAKKLSASLSGSIAGSLADKLPGGFKETLKLRAVGLTKIPMLFFLSPSVVEITDHRCVVKIPLTRRSKNHLGSMYFGALAAGADCAGGLIAWKLAEKKVSLVFKDFKADFLKRAEGDVFFACEEGLEIRKLVERVASSGSREHMPVHVTATVPSKLGNEPVARFVLTLSLKSL
jgi:acyl-coenzyme A thioesterase PaaI-like protein